MSSEEKKCCMAPSRGCGTATFVGLRLLSIPLQTSILYYDLGSHCVHRLKNDPPAVPLNRLALNPSPARDLPITRMVLLAMATGSSLKQILFAGCLNHECMLGCKPACRGLFETVSDAINLLFFTNNALSPSFATSQDELTPTLLVGGAMYVLGMLIEITAESQRRCFKKCKKNADAPINVGLWKYARHINYAGYLLWRAGFAIAAGGWKLGIASGIVHGIDALRHTKKLEECYSEKVRDIRSCAMARLMDTVWNVKGFGVRNDVMYAVGETWSDSELMVRQRVLIVR